MQILIAPNWEDYELIDSGDQRRFERFGPYTVVRPDPQAIWKPKLNDKEWQKADATFILTGKSSTERGEWRFQKKLPNKWLCGFNNLKFWVSLSPFKHTGVFPEQSIWWDYIAQKIRKSENQNTGKPYSSDTQIFRSSDVPNILNLFGYTGIASLAASDAGAKVTHVDASYPTIGQFKENIKASKLEDKGIRFILDDCLKFVQREAKRGVKYDGVIMDPPVYGHGPKGERWEFNESFPKLMAACKEILSEQPLFVIVNAYALSSSAIMLENVMNDFLGDLRGSIEVGELALQESKGGRLLSTGIFARWEKKPKSV
jgi:23S rRNA (cytosine1962-C5)-methyltransferase